MSEPAAAAPDGGTALLAAAAAKAGLVWVFVDGAPPQALWHAWHEGAVLVVVGGSEQRDPFGQTPAAVRLSVPSKDTRSALVELDVILEPVLPSDGLWQEATTLLKAGRLNARDADGLVARWAEHSRVLRLVPSGPAERSASTASGSAPVDVEGVRPRGWRPLRSRLRPRSR